MEFTVNDFITQCGMNAANFGIYYGKQEKWQEIFNFINLNRFVIIKDHRNEIVKL